MSNKMKIQKVKGRAMLHWMGKKPINNVENYPAQLIEMIGAKDPPATPNYEVLKENWSNLLFQGDNKEVLSTLLVNGFRGKVDLIYIDPPFDSGADYVRRVELRGTKQKVEGEEQTTLEQVQYEDIWANDNYLQFMYERLIMLRELLSDNGSIYLHCDWHKGHYLRILMDEVFGPDNFVNDIVWNYKRWTAPSNNFQSMHDNIFWYAKNKTNRIYNTVWVTPANVEKGRKENYQEDEEGKLFRWQTANGERYRIYRDERGVHAGDVWDIAFVHPSGSERTDYPTQKPEKLLERIIKASTNEDSIILDCFIGSGTTAAVAQQLGLRWIGADINKGAIQTTMKRLQKSSTIEKKKSPTLHYRVNNYDFQEFSVLREIIIEKYGVKALKTDVFFDGLVGPTLVKVAELNKPITRLDIQSIIDELNNRNDEARDILLIGSGVELGVDSMLVEYNKLRPINKINIKDIQQDGVIVSDPAEADVSILKSSDKVNVKINSYLSPTIIKRLDIDRSIFGEHIKDFRAQIDVILIDTNYDGKTFKIVFSDVPERKRDFVGGEYNLEMPKNSKKVAVKIVDMLGEETLTIA